MRFTDTGCWTTDDPNDSEHAFDFALCVQLRRELDRAECRTALDLGCGMGDYVRTLRKWGIDCHGVDGNPNTPVLSGGLCEVADLSVPLNIGRKFDAVYSLEVGEHIPAQFETQFLENIATHATKFVVLSWAVEGQGGLGHVNCRSNGYIEGRMAALGFTRDRDVEGRLREMAHLSWFKDTIMVFLRH